MNATSLLTAAMTDVGCMRHRNEDCFLVSSRDALGIEEGPRRALPEPGRSGANECLDLLAVADGLGGHAAGDVASKMAVNVLLRCFKNKKCFCVEQVKLDPSLVAKQLEDAFSQTHQTILDATMLRRDRVGMATTLTAALVYQRHAWIAHCGDTRCYLLSASGIKQLTRDHTVGARVRENHQEPVSEEQDHVLWNCLGGNPSGDLQVDLMEVQLEAHDQLLLCSDGLTEHLEDVEIEHILRTGNNADEACRKLIAMTNDRGGHDNITVVIGR